MEEKVSIITPSFNSEKYIMKTIKSVQNQSYKNWEMIIVDDYSNDSTCEIVKKIAKSDQRIKLIKQNKNAGAGAARNRALNEANGRFIAYLDSDDIWKEDKLKMQVNYMKKKNCGFSCVSYEVRYAIFAVWKRIYIGGSEK